MHRKQLFSALALILSCASLARAQDRNDWEAYYQAGIDKLRNDPRGAEEMFAHASHLRPDRAEPIYGAYIAFWSQEMDLFRETLLDDEKTAYDPKVLHADSLRMRALRRNPFVHEGLIMYLYDRLPGRWNDDPITRGWIAFGTASLPRALALFGQELQRNPEKYGYLRFIRASAFVNSGQSDSAAAEITARLAQLRAMDKKVVGNGYQSKELLEYALGLLQIEGRHATAARQAFERAVVENAGFSPAHAMLGEMAVSRRDTATALLEYGTAAELDPNDVEIQLGYGKALRVASHPTEAIARFKKAIAIEPEYATPYFWLGVTLDGAGDKPGAKEAFGQYLAHAAQNDSRRAEAEAFMRQ